VESGLLLLRRCAAAARAIQLNASLGF